MRVLALGALAVMLAGCVAVPQAAPFQSPQAQPFLSPVARLYLPLLYWDGRYGKGIGMTHTWEADACADALAVGATWGYNWGTLPPKCDGMATLPMVYGLTEGCPALGPGRYVLAFNEPDRPDQANMTPEAAAWEFRRLTQDCAPERAFTTPAVILTETNDGLLWLDAWWHALPEPPRTKTLAIHCYAWTSADVCIWRLSEALVWAAEHGLTETLVTEWAVLPCQIGEQAAISENQRLAAWLAAQPQIIGYAFFATRILASDLWAFQPYAECTTGLFAGDAQLSAFGQWYQDAP